MTRLLNWYPICVSPNNGVHEPVRTGGSMLLRNGQIRGTLDNIIGLAISVEKYRIDNQSLRQNLRKNHRLVVGQKKHRSGTSSAIAGVRVLLSSRTTGFVDVMVVGGSKFWSAA